MKDYFHPCASIINTIITFFMLINMNLDINFSTISIYILNDSFIYCYKINLTIKIDKH